jgi:hypothetical protein
MSFEQLVDLIGRMNICTHGTFCSFIVLLQNRCFLFFWLFSGFSSFSLISAVQIQSFELSKNCYLSYLMTCKLSGSVVWCVSKIILSMITSSTDSPPPLSSPYEIDFTTISHLLQLYPYSCTKLYILGDCNILSIQTTK